MSPNKLLLLQVTLVLYHSNRKVTKIATTNGFFCMYMMYVYVCSHVCAQVCVYMGTYMCGAPEVDVFLHYSPLPYILRQDVSLSGQMSVFLASLLWRCCISASECWDYRPCWGFKLWSLPLSNSPLSTEPSLSYCCCSPCSIVVAGQIDSHAAAVIMGTCILLPVLQGPGSRNTRNTLT